MSFLRCRNYGLAILSAVAMVCGQAGSVRADLPLEPIEIGTEPQFLFDNYLVDNSWAIKYKRESLQRVFHTPEKFAGNPVIPEVGGYVSVAREPDGTFKLWYQRSVMRESKDEAPQVAVAYAESRDGVKWALPNLGLVTWQGNKDNNVVLTGLRRPNVSGPFLIEAHESDRRGHKYLLLHSDTDGLRLIGSNDGIHWDQSSNTHLKKLHSDTQNSIVYDPRRGEYILFCRAKHIYRTFQGEILDTGESRRVARLTNKDLWSEWSGDPQTILVPDDTDEARGFNCFYGMPVKYYGGVFWGWLWPFKMNTDIDTELAFSRDGIRFDRLPSRPKLIARGGEGSWDDGMVFGSPSWIEVGDEWWLYYAGWDGPHESRERTPGIGLAKMRKERFISVLGPRSGGVLVTRQIRWPGGKLLVNADAGQGELRVRVTDARRKPLPGFDYSDCVPLTEDRVTHEITWNDASLADQSGQVIRLEFLLKDTHLFSMRATGQ